MLAGRGTKETEYDLLLYWKASRSFSMQTAKGRLLFRHSPELASSNAQPPLENSARYLGKTFHSIEPILLWRYQVKANGCQILPPVSLISLPNAPFPLA